VPQDVEGPRGYIAKHWRGELSLATSYWVNVFLIGLVFAKALLHEDLGKQPVSSFATVYAVSR
jgi:hypothetical protein